MFYLRLFLALSWFFLLTVVALLFLLWPGGQEWAGHWYASNMTRVVLKIFGMQMDVQGEEKIFANAPCIIVGNHQSNFDVVVHGSFYPRNCVVIGKKEILWIPLWGLLFKYTGQILLDRKNPDRARQGIEDAKQAILTRKKSIYMFPEGTRSHGSEMGPFKKGAFHMAIAAQVPIVAVVASPTHALFDERKRISRPGVIQVHVIGPFPTQGLTINDVDKLLNTVRDNMVEESKKIQTRVL